MESVAHFKWAAGLLLKGSAIVLCYQWEMQSWLPNPSGLEGAWRLPQLTGRKKTREGESVDQWPFTYWRTERQIHLSADSPSPWFWSDLEDKHSPATFWEKKVHWASVVCPEAKEYLFHGQLSARIDLLYHILWSRCLALVLCVSFVLVLAFFCLPFSGSPWFIRCQMIFILAACQGGAGVKNTVEQKVLRTQLLLADTAVQTKPMVPKVVP